MIITTAGIRKYAGFSFSWRQCIVSIVRYTKMTRILASDGNRDLS